MTRLFFVFAFCIDAKAQIINTIAGSGTAGFLGDGGPATNAELSSPCGVAVDRAGNVYFLDGLNARMRKINTTGIITTIAGDGILGFSGDGGIATAAEIAAFIDAWITTDGAGNIYFGDKNNFRVRKVTPSDTITTIAGNGAGIPGGYGGAATAAHIGYAEGIALDDAGNIYFSDGVVYIRKVDATGILTIYAGDGTESFSGDGGQATSAGLDGEEGITMDSYGNLYIVDEYNYRLRKVSTAGIITTIAGTGIYGNTGDGGPATAAEIVATYDIAVDGCGNLYFPGGLGIRRIGVTGIVRSIAGNGTTIYGGDGGPATAAGMNAAGGIAVDAYGNLYLCDESHIFVGVSLIPQYRIREITGLNHLPSFTGGHSITLAVCDGVTSDSINGLLAIIDLDTLQMETWSVLTAPIHGSVEAAYSAISTGDTITPTGLHYTPAAGYTGTDSFRVMVKDCNNGTDTTTIHVSVTTSIPAIAGGGAVCAGASVTMGDSVAGGTWSSPALTVGIGTATGIVTGVSAGTAIISYTIGGSCTESKTVTVNAAPAPVIGPSSACLGSAITLIDTSGSVSAGASWTETPTSLVIIAGGFSDTVSMSGYTVGAGTITFSLANGCKAYRSMTVNPVPESITGTTSVCAGGTAALSDTGGGTWSSGNTTIATIEVTAGIVHGMTAGTSMITYMAGTGCMVTANVTVNPLPTVSPGTINICAGATTTVSAIPAGGSWSSSNTGIAALPGAGMVSGLAGGATSLVYTLPTGCSAAAAITVNALPPAITGTTSVCAGATTTLASGTGGTWSSSNTAKATINSTGTVYGITAGTSTITYTAVTGCTVVKVVTVNPLPSAINGIATTCTGASTTLSDTTAGGTWSSGNTYVATVSGLGAVSGISATTVIISYTAGTGCAVTKIVTVNLAPLPIEGTFSLCAGSAAYLYDAVAGGAWSSSNSAVATVDSMYGIIAGMSAGMAMITYTLGSCAATALVTINPIPFLIIGPPAICVGQTTTLSDVATGGTWTTDSAAITVDLFYGTASGISAGVATITYMLSTGCSVTKTITVDTSPGAIAGTPQVCAGLTTVLSDPGGGSWTSSNTSIATIGTAGTVSGITAGTTIITYSIGASCSTAATVTVNPLPHAIGGIAVACAGATTTLTSTGSGTWTPATGGIATVGSTGVVSGIAGGTATITFTLPTGCATTSIVTINSLPAAIGGTLTICQAATTTLNDLTTGGAWSSSNSAIGTIGTASGIVSGVAPGISVITYTAPGTGCSRTALVTINPLPTLPTAASICAGATATLSDGTSGGTWSSGATSFATINSAGTVTGVMGGTTATISYTLGTGCARTAIVTVNPVPTITGPTAECVGATMTEMPAPTGGTWSSATTSVAAISSPATGGVTGVATGTTVITYTSLAGCKAARTITISLSPTGILGSATVCANDTMSLNDAVGGGVWSSSNTAAATIGSLTPLVTGIAAGTTMITYSLGTTGCTVTRIITVNPPVPLVSGSAGMSMCIGAATTLTDAATGGTWSSSPASVATILGTGAVTGAAAGTASVSYTLSTTGCSASAVVTVNPTPSPIIGTAQVCAGSTTTLGDLISGGTWASPDLTVGIASLTGIVTGIISGTATITYSLGAGCAVTKVVTVNPIAAITGSLGICVGATTALADGAGGATGGVSGGTWSSGTTSVAGVSGAGVVTGTAVGTSTIAYTTAAGCTATAVVTVNLAPSAISGVLHVCAGATTSLGNTAGGGTWISSNTGVATVGSTGIVTGIIHGAATITYSLGSGCTVTAVATVNLAPVAIAGVENVCVGLTTVLSDVTTGGTWSIAPTAAATLSSPAGGGITGLSAGTAVVSYTLSDGCAASVIVTVNPIPSPISGGGDICVGTTETLTSGISGGSWSSSNTGIATTNSLTGDITGVSPGPATITYSLPTGCSTNMALTVNAAPAPISGGTSVCTGSIIALSDPPGAGVWGSGNTAIATVTSSGIVSGIAPGTSTISYTAGGCPATVVVTVNSLPGAIGGTARVCMGSTATLSDLPGGGTWSIAGGGVATVIPLISGTGSTGIVTGVAAGTATVAYSMGTGCTVTATVTVDAVPLAITGTAEVCVGYTTSLSDPSTGTWSSSNTLIASISASGNVHGLTGGPSTISYTNSVGCAATRLVTVIAVPPILGVNNMCAFSGTLPLYDSAAGGFWTSTLASISSSGVVTPYSAGVAGVTYTLPLGCYITATLTVNPLPGPVVGLDHLCLGSTISMSDTSSSGTWSSSNTTVAAISSPATGGIEALSAGVSIISYALGTGCATTETITVDVFPEAGTITGLSVVCVGATIVLSDGAGGATGGAGGVGGGVWSASNTDASVGSTGSLSGVVTGVTAGMDIISYVVSNSCGSAATTKTVTINPLPNAGAISGFSSVCTGSAITLTESASGGTWSASNGDATVGSTGSLSGLVTGITAGADTILYSVTNSCGTATATKIITVNPLAVAGTITGTASVCVSAATALSDAATGGVWSSGSVGVATAGVTGIVTGVSAGTATVSYSVTNVCTTATATEVVTVDPLPVVGAIMGIDSVCVGDSIVLSESVTGGTWASIIGNTSVSGLGVVTGIIPGTDTISYTVSTATCGSAVAVLAVNVLSASECNTGVAPSGSPQGGEVLRVWPNPNNGMFSVALLSDADEVVLLTITNLVGEKVMEVATVTNKATDVKLNEAAGVYFISAASEEGKYVVKVVVND